MAKVKICGITSAEDAIAAIKAGADYIGLIVEIPRSKSNLGREEAKKIVDSVRGKVPTVALTEHCKAEEIAGLCSFIGCSLAQIHSNAGREELLELKKLSPGLKVIRAIDAGSNNALALIQTLSDAADFFVLDTASRQGIGGTGKPHNWQASAALVKKSRLPCFLAGGLNPKNVAEAIAAVKPFAVDASSGLKSGPNPRKLDFEKAEAFVEKAKRLD